MALTATTGDSVQIGTGATFQVCVTVVTAGGKTISDTFTYDGSLADITAQVKARIAQRNAQGKIPSVPTGTQLDLTDPAPTPPTQAQLDQAAYITQKSKVVRIKQLRDLGSSHVTQADLDNAVAAWNALTYDPAFEGL
jgi:hypothetical protein